MSSIQEQLIKYVAHHLDRELLLGIEDAILSAYKAAHEDTERRIKNTPKSRFRSQARRYYIDEALAGLNEKFQSKVRPTEPRGEHYVMLCSGNITLSHIELHSGAKPRAAKHRKMMALRNAILEPQNLDFWKSPPPDLKDSLHVVATVIHPASGHAEQFQPQSLRVTIPYTDWNGTHLDVELSKLYEQYDVSEELSQLDTAWPSLKIALRKAEGQE